MTPEQQKALALAEARRRQTAPPPAPQQVTDAQGTPYVLNPNTGQMTSRDLLANAVQPNRFDAAATGYLSGYAMSGADEVAGALGGDFAREQTRARFEANKEAFPNTSLAAEMTGMVGSPLTWAAPATASVRGAMGIGLTAGAIEGFLRGEGVEDRSVKATQGAATGAAFSGLLSAGVKYSHKGLQALAERTNKKLTLDDLVREKNAAYKLVEDAGERFTGEEMLDLAILGDEMAKSRFFVADTDKQTKAALKTLERAVDQNGITLPQLDKIRRSFWDRYSRESEPAVLDMIKGIDDLIGTRAETSKLMANARLANARKAKFELLDNAFHKARRDTAAQGDGRKGLINRYKQAVNRILSNDKEMRFFSDTDRQLMESFVFSDETESILRTASKLSPNGNGLMTALAVYGAAVDPTMLAVTAGASAAQGATDKLAARGAADMLESLGSGSSVARRRARLNVPAVAGGVAVPAYIRDRNN